MATTYNHELARFALNKTIKNVDFDEIIVASDKKIETEAYDKQKNYFIQSNFSVYEWNYYVTYHLHDVVKTDHVLIIQPDGFACKKHFWDDNFLNYDFISSPVCYGFSKVKNTLDMIEESFNYSKDTNKPFIFNGGGGFSLRSKNFLKFTKDNIISFTDSSVASKESLSVTCEDFISSVFLREKAEQSGLRFADLPTTFKFSTEDIFNYGLCFGFHGFHNIPLFLDEYETLYFMDHMEIDKMLFYGSLKPLEMNLVFKEYNHAIAKLEYMKKSMY